MERCTQSQTRLWCGFFQFQFPDQFQVFGNVQIKTQVGQVDDLEPGIGYLDALAVTLKGIHPKIIFNQPRGGHEQGIRAGIMPVG